MAREALDEKYATQFCEEHDSPNIIERRKGDLIIVGPDGSKTTLISREYSKGPPEIFPWSLDKFERFVARKYSEKDDKRVNYENVKEIVLAGNPELVGREYISRMEYEITVGVLFNRALNSIMAERLESEFDRRVENEKKAYSRLGWFFGKNKVRSKVAESLQKRVQRMNELYDERSYHKIRPSFLQYAA